MDLSIVIPLFNEEESLPELEAWIRRVVEKEGYSYEIIMVDDGSSDKSWSVVRELSEKNPHLKGIKFRRNHGKSPALQKGFEAAQGDVVITMDADLQDSPDEIPELVRMIREDGFDLVSGWKQKRHDPLNKTLPSKVFNKVVSIVSHIKLHDFNCGLKAYRNEVVKAVELYGDLHRFIPLLAKWSGFNKIGEKVVQHQERKYGVSKFGWERLITGFLDLLSIVFVGRFGKRPMHFFGTLGVICISFGFLTLIYLSIAKMVFEEYGIAERPLFFFGILALILGTQLFVTGFLAELVVKTAPDRNTYVIEERLNLPNENSQN
jgi:glycosyltransferase involved in cell wall biosynthesis